ncbi:MAG: flagellar protein FlgN [Lachnospiraceae bacterium]
MASLMDELLDVLDRENTEYEGLVSLSKKKKQVIIDADIKELQEITAQEEEIANRIVNLEGKFTQVIKDMAVVLNRKPEELTIDEMVRILHKQPVEQKRLNDLRVRLKTTLQEMNDINAQNQSLINQALEMIEFDLTLFRSIRQAPETANYDKKAYNTGELLANSGFDARQ